ncbi:hypothetical protein PSACC_02316 [Paramicrosporidium saccamoebae]|uniref:GPI mannosyltransferase 1 n=1 Tax=Paramicrosporidium saccamoebae TaxID=1246581 RepID=A0A2H9TJH5_9FUNG|nr:hypothetical protein PSACC_02316 [Paramicrosporidium saccamoebae]
MRAFLQAALLAVFVRVVLLVYGAWQDRTLEVKYTDVDYWVFSDAAAAVRAGGSPYSRHTFRYTPLLAVLLVPNGWTGGMFGKVLFCAFDLVAAYFIYLFLLRGTNPSRAARLVGLFWLLNPMVFTISTRGNAESLLSVLVLSSLYFITSNRPLLGGLAYGAAVHFKLFPIIYSIAILAHLVRGRSKKLIESPPMSPKLETPTASPTPSREGSPSFKNKKKKQQQPREQRPASTLATPQKVNFIQMHSASDRIRSIFVFGLASLASFLVLTGICYRLYGMEYIEQSFLYHLTRRDHRHNYSPYFYLFYTDAVTKLPQFTELAVFIPQIVFFLVAGIKFGKKDLAFACFIITFVFVAFNKVITSQYFLWYLALFPMAYNSMHNITSLRWTAMSVLWFGAQGLWLNLAYRLEFLGQEVFVAVWAASILFLLVNVWIAAQFIRHRFVPEVFHAGPGIITLNSAAM